MSSCAAIAWREFASYYRTSAGWLIGSLFLLLAGFVFAFGALRPGEPATMRDFFTLSNWLMMFVCPAISMRLVADERRTGTIEALLTAPVSAWSVAAGKFAGGAGFLASALAATLVLPLTLAAVSDPPAGPIIAGYTGLALLGVFYLSVGALCSALTESQAVAYLSALFALLLLRMVAAQGPMLVEEPWAAALRALSVERRLADFGRGVIDGAHAVFFAAGAGALLVATAAAIDLKGRG